MAPTTVMVANLQEAVLGLAVDAPTFVQVVTNAIKVSHLSSQYALHRPCAALLTHPSSPPPQPLHCTLHCPLHCPLHCSLHCSLHYLVQLL